MCVLPGGRVVFVELKSYGKKPTPLQEIEINRLKDLGFEVFVIDHSRRLATFVILLRHAQYTGKRMIISENKSPDP